MTPIRIAEEMIRYKWAMTQSSFDAMRSVVDGLELSAEDYKYFHALETGKKEAIASTLGKRVDGSVYSSILGNVGFLMIDGPIIPRATWFSKASGMVSLDVAGNEFKALDSNRSIDTIVQLFDTPGGIVSGATDYVAIVKASQKKTYSFGWMAASLGALIASASDEVVLAEDGTMGSIGVVMSLVDRSESDKKKGVRQIEIVSSQSPDKRPDSSTPEGRSVLQAEVNDLADVIISSIATNRNVSVETVLNDFGKGAMMVASKAVSVGMADRVSDIESFVSGLVASKQSYFSMPVRSGTNKESHQMANENTTPTADQLREQYPSAVKEIEQKASAKGAAGERKRLKAIEGLSKKFASHGPITKGAVVKAITSCKYDVGDDGEFVSSGDAAMKVLNAVADAGNKDLEASAAPRVELAEAAEHAGSASVLINQTDDQTTKEASVTRIKNLKAAKKSRLKGKG